MYNRQSSLSVLQGFVSECDSIGSILLVKHEVEINWSQMYKSTKEKTKAIGEVYTVYNKGIEEYWFDRAKFLSQNISNLRHMCKENEVFSVASLVETKNKQYFHFALMNLHPRSGVTLQDLNNYLKYISGDRKGVLVKTDRYFHYIGYYLLTNKEWLRFLGKILIPFVFVNPGYIGYSLLRGYCCIRLTAANKVKKVIPYVIKEV